MQVRSRSHPCILHLGIKMRCSSQKQPFLSHIYWTRKCKKHGSGDPCQASHLTSTQIGRFPRQTLEPSSQSVMEVSSPPQQQTQSRNRVFCTINVVTDSRVTALRHRTFARASLHLHDPQSVCKQPPSACAVSLTLRAYTYSTYAPRRTPIGPLR